MELNADKLAMLLEGVCVYILQDLSAMRERNGWTNMVSNSAKIVNTITAHRFNTILRRTPDCVEIACSGVFQGGIAAGWAFFDLKSKGIAPKALIFGVTNPVMVQGAVFANITITEGWSREPSECIRTGDFVRVDPTRQPRMS